MSTINFGESSDEEDVAPRRPVDTATTTARVNLDSTDDEADAMDDGGRHGHRVTVKKQEPPSPPQPTAPAAREPAAGRVTVKQEPPPPQPLPQPKAPAARQPAAGAGAGKKRAVPNWKPAPKVEVGEGDEEDDEDLGGQQQVSRARWLTGGNSAKRAKPGTSAVAAAAVPVKEEKASAKARSSKPKGKPKAFPPARAVKQKQEAQGEEDEEDSDDGVEYDDWGEVVGIKKDAKGPPKGEKALAVWRKMVALALLEGEKEKRILESACNTLKKFFAGIAKQTDEELWVAAAAIEEGQRAAAALQALGLSEGGSKGGVALAGAGTGRGGKRNVWAETEPPMQESDGEAEAGGMPSEAEIAELRAKVERGKQVEEEARARRLFRAEEQAPLALGAAGGGGGGGGAGDGGVDIRRPDPTRRLSALERVLSIELLCDEIYGSLPLEAMCALRTSSRAGYLYYDEVAFIKAVGQKCKAWQKEETAKQKAGGGGRTMSEFGAAIAELNQRERRRRGQERRRWRGQEQQEDDGSSSSAAARRRSSKKERKRAKFSVPSSGSEDSGEEEEEEGGLDISCLVDEGEEDEEGEQDLAALMEKARTVSYQRQHGLGRGALEVRKQEGKCVLNGDMAQQARENVDHSVRRRVEALLARRGIRLFPSTYDEGESESDSDDENEPPCLINVKARGRGQERKATVRVESAKGWKKKRVDAVASKRLKVGVDAMAQFDVLNSKLGVMKKEVKTLKEHMRYVGYNTETVLPGLGTVKVMQPGAGAQQYANKLCLEVFESLPEETRLAILDTRLVKYQAGKLVATAGKKRPREGSEAASDVLLQVEREGAGHVPTYKKMQILNAHAKAKAAAAEGGGGA